MIPSRDTPASPSTITIAVIGALLLRDMKTRAGRSFTGYFLTAGVPLVHLAAVVSVYHLLGRQIPVGSDAVLYLSLSVLPFVVFVYPSRQIMISIAANKPLMALRRVRIIDFIVARGVLEFFTGWIVSAVLVTAIFVLGSEINPNDPYGVMLAIAATSYFGFAVGFMNALISIVFPAWNYVFAVITPALWITSGIIFFPAAVPTEYHGILSWNPLLQCTEWIRYAWFENYPDTLLNVPYLLLFSTFIICISLFVERFYIRKAL